MTKQERVMSIEGLRQGVIVMMDHGIFVGLGGKLSMFRIRGEENVRGLMDCRSL